MIFNDNMIFIHIGKTGGMSCSNYLLKNLNGNVYNCHDKAFEEMAKWPIDGIIPKSGIARHCTLAEALKFIEQVNGKQLADFKKVVVVIRHPFTLEYSFYKHLQKPKVKELRKKNPKLIELAEGNFKNFVEKAGYHRKGCPQEAFFLLDNKIPPCIAFVRFEQLNTDFPRIVAPFTKTGDSSSFPHTNRTNYQSKIDQELTEEVRYLIYQKHKFMFDSGLYSTKGMYC